MKIGFSEILVILIVAMVFIGPDKVPVYARKIGKLLNQLREYTGIASKQMEDTIAKPMQEIQKPLNDVMNPLNAIQKDLNVSVSRTIDSIGVKKAPDKVEAAKKDAEAEPIEELEDLPDTASAEETAEQPAKAAEPFSAAIEAKAPAEEAEVPSTADSQL